MSSSRSNNFNLIAAEKKQLVCALQLHAEFTGLTER